MGFKSASVVLLGLALCCFFQGTTAIQGECVLEFLPDRTKPNPSGWIEGEGTRYAPFTTWYISGGDNKTRSLYNSIEDLRSQEGCEECILTTYESNDLTGKSYGYDFRTGRIDFSFPASVKSFNLKCFREGNLVFQEMNENDGSTLPHSLVDLRHKAFPQAVDRLVSKGLLSAGQYTSERVFSTEFSENYEGVYRFHVHARDASGVEYRIWFTTYAYTEDYQNWNAIVIEVGYKENRIGEFTPQFKVLPPVEESQEPYPATVEEMGMKSILQAVGRLKTKGILPQGTYSNFIGFYAFNSLEYSSIVNMPEYPDHNDILYRFKARAIDQSGIIYRVWTVIATNYETPENYELIDYSYKQSKLEEFTDPDWQEFNQGEPLPPDSAWTRMRDLSVARAVPRLQAEGKLPVDKYTIANTYATEFAFGFVNDNWPYFTSQPTDGLYRFNVQITNEAGTRYRIAVVVATNYDIQPQHELIDYFSVENRLDEFTNTNFRSLNVEDIQTESINEAIDRLIAKSTLPAGQYTISKTFPTAFSANFEHPDYSTDEYILYKFTAQVKNAAGTEYKVYSIVIAAYDAPQDFELIDYGEINA